MRKLIAALIATGAATFGLASYATIPLESAFYWLLGGGAAVTVASQMAQHTWGRTNVKIGGGTITFQKPGKKEYGPYPKS